MDPARRMTDRELKKLEKKIRKEYAQALKETQAKLDDHFRKFKVKDAAKWRQLKEGKITLKEYREWRLGQMATGKRWEEMRRTIARDMEHSREIARAMANGTRVEVYALNHDFIGYQIERQFGLNTSFTIYNHEAVERIIKKNPVMLPPPGKQMLDKLARGEAVKWEEGQIQSVVTQAILQGESVPNMARRISTQLAVQGMAAAIRYARTAITGAENAGRLDGMRQAVEMGVKMEKQWFAALDDRTREAHRELDGQSVPVNEPFVNSIGEIMFPGDPDARDAENIWNCRCSMIANLKGFERDASDLSKRNTEKMGDMSYEEWREAKARSQDIMEPVETERIMKMRYIRDYKR